MHRNAQKVKKLEQNFVPLRMHGYSMVKCAHLNDAAERAVIKSLCAVQTMNRVRQ